MPHPTRSHPNTPQRRLAPTRRRLRSCLAAAGVLLLVAISSLFGPVGQAGAQSSASACEAPTGIRDVAVGGETFTLSILASQTCTVTQFIQPSVSWITQTGFRRDACGFNCSRDTYTFTVARNPGPAREAAFQYTSRVCNLGACNSFPGTYVIRQAGAETIATATSAASFSPDRITHGGLAVLFGRDLATTTVSAATEPLPFTLGGTTVVAEKGGTRVPARLKYVSPGQVNIEVPAAIGQGTVTFRVTSATGRVSVATATVRAKAPDVFTIANGTGHASLSVLRIGADGTQRYEGLSYDPSGRVVPVEVNRPGERVFFVLLATGVRNEPFPANNRIRFTNLTGTRELTPSYAGPAPCCTGVDQINVEIPASLAGSGVNTVQFFSGLERVPSNTFDIAVR